MATPGTSDTSLDTFTSWLETIAENTARTREAVMSPVRSVPARASDAGTAGNERALNALGERFGSGPPQLERMPVEAVIASAFDGSMRHAELTLSPVPGAERDPANRGFAGTVEGDRYAAREASAVDHRMWNPSGSPPNVLTAAGIAARSVGTPDADGAPRFGAAAYSGARVADTLADAPQQRAAGRPFEPADRFDREGPSRVGRPDGVAIDSVPSTPSARGASGFTYSAQRSGIQATVEDGHTDDAGALKPVVELLLRIIDVLTAMLPGGAPPPTSAGPSGS
jgi:hypothetical protein